MDSTPNTAPPVVPFALETDVLGRMLNFEIADDPTYSGLEIQAFDDEHHGTGVAVLLARRSDDVTDVYYEPGLELDPANYAIGGGLGIWAEARFDVGRLEVTSRGVDAEVRFTDTAGRIIEVEVADRTRRPRRLASFLAPLGAAITDPRSLMLVWMAHFDLLRRTGPPPVIRIDGRDATPGRLPAEWLMRRRLIKVASDLFVVLVNPTRDQVTEPVPTGGEMIAASGAIEAVTATHDRHRAELRFAPPVPDLAALDEGDVATGAWHVVIDGSRLIAGTWRASRNGSERQLGMDVTEGWRPRGLPMLMKIVTRVAPVFRNWPTTYRWLATVTLGAEPKMTSRWERTGTERGESYRSMTRSR